MELVVHAMEYVGLGGILGMVVQGGIQHEDEVSTFPQAFLLGKDEGTCDEVMDHPSVDHRLAIFDQEKLLLAAVVRADTRFGFVLHHCAQDVVQLEIPVELVLMVKMYCPELAELLYCFLRF